MVSDGHPEAPSGGRVVRRTGRGRHRRRPRDPLARGPLRGRVRRGGHRFATPAIPKRASRRSTGPNRWRKSPTPGRPSKSRSRSSRSRSSRGLSRSTSPSGARRHRSETCSRRSPPLGSSRRSRRCTSPSRNPGATRRPDARSGAVALLARSLLKETEQRAEAWRGAHGVEQTEIDALAAPARPAGADRPRGDGTVLRLGASPARRQGRATRRAVPVRPYPGQPATRGHDALFGRGPSRPGRHRARR